ncbi:MAG: glycosyltransferase family 4 protein [Bacteroidetes bacterium]|nr:glycosyltransferase family 4 protein [Bacteroidota bacterium]
MKIALITDGIWPYVMGGMQKHSFYLCKYFAKNKIYVDLVHFNQSNFDIERLEFFDETEKAFINSTIIPFPKSIHFPGHYLYNSYRHSKLIYNKIKPLLSSYTFIYTKGFTGWHLINKKSKKKIICPPIGVKFHGYEMFQQPISFKIWLQHVFILRLPVKKICKKSDVVFSYGGEITKIIKSIGIDSTKIIELPSGVEKETVAPTISNTNKPLKFLFLGRYERRKGLEEIYEAIALCQSYNFEFYFIGNLPKTKLNIKHTYFGEVRDKQQLLNQIKACDILLCPSYSEGMPNVVLEAMASGLAVIATNVGATNVLVNNNTGWLLPKCNSKLIAEHLTNVINTPKHEIENKKQNALNLISDNFVWDNLIQKLIYQISNLPNRR